MSSSRILIIGSDLYNVHPLHRRGKKFYRIIQASTGMTRLDYLSKFEVTDQPEPLKGRTAVLVGTGAMRQCGVFVKPWPFLWARIGTSRVVYVPPFGPIYRDRLMLKTAMLFYKELVQEFQLV